VILLDTHVILWIAANVPLRANASLIDAAGKAGEIYVSAVSAWEIATLVRKGRLRLTREPVIWFRDFATRPGVNVAPLTASAAASSGSIPGLSHEDPADRLLISTARELRAAFVTRDRNIQTFATRSGFISTIVC
jgi:PIN domain nuclease of toxin-antitoxin system